MTSVVGARAVNAFEEGLLPSKLSLYPDSMLILQTRQLIISMESGSRVVKVNGLT